VADRVRPYLFYDVAVSICSTCFRKVEGKIVFENGSVFMLRRCPAHGSERVLMADDVEYYRRCREVFIKPPEMPLAFNTPVRWGCPYDCGLCADHQQHSCLSLVEITDRCNLECPICYAGSGPSRHQYRTLEHVQRLIDAVVRYEGQPDVVQISGGEPTVHPDFFAILDRAKQAPIRHLMVNTNGLRIAHDEEFAKRLAGYMPDFEIYLQFDSLQAGPLLALRGADLRDVHARALERLNRLGISTTLVVTIKKGLNDAEIGRILDFAVTQPSVRGVTFQPIQAAGRLEHFDPSTDRLTLTEVRRRILEQTTLFRPEDLLPVPCHPDSLAMAYALKIDGKLIPLTGLIDPKAKALGEMTRGSTATIERQDGQKMDVVIQEITPDAVTIMRQQQDHVVTETIPIADIAKIKKTSAKKMSKTSKVLIGTAVAFGVLVIAALASCGAASYSQPSAPSQATN
jgi:tetraether lipid synthase